MSEKYWVYKSLSQRLANMQGGILTGSRAQLQKEGTGEALHSHSSLTHLYTKVLLWSFKTHL